MGRRLVVIGAGPIGIEAALAAQARGFDVSLFERDVVGASLLSWGPTTFFSPFGMNVSARVRNALGDACPEHDALLTGPDFVKRVLKPLVDGKLSGVVHEQHEVVKIARDRLLRRDRAGHPMRGERCFRLLVDGPDGERIAEADAVLDASGAMQPNALGQGGLLAPGERAVSNRFLRTLSAVHRRLPELDGRRVLVVGHGHSAANAIVALADFAADHPTIKVTWATRSLHRKPCLDIASDPLAERHKIVERANRLAHEGAPWLTVERRAHVERFERDGEAVTVHLSGDRSGTFDAIVGFVGHHPDTSLFSELAVEVSPVTEGAAGIQRALANVTDCLSVPNIGAEDLSSGEPGFYMIGYKSYGRMATFLLKDGLAQLESILDVLEQG